MNLVKLRVNDDFYKNVKYLRMRRVGQLIKKLCKKKYL